MPRKDQYKKPFTSYLSTALQNSMITGLPEITAAENIPKKILRSFVFIFCVAGFLYQTLTFLNLYWEYHTVVDVKVTNPRDTTLPGITFCNLNGIYASKVCKKNIDGCLKYTTDDEKALFCKKHPRYCPSGIPENNLSFPGEEELLPLFSLPQKDVEDVLQPFTELMDSCKGYLMSEDGSSEECSFQNLISVRSPSGFRHRNVCYTMFSLVGKPEEDPKSVLSVGYLLIVLDPKVQEYQLNVPEVSIQIGFHDPRGYGNPYIGGSTLLERKENTFLLRKSVKILLPEPYETKCVDYLKRWKENGGRGPLSENDCIQECLANASLQVLKCIADVLDYPSNEAYCADKIITQEVLDISQQCTATQCGSACWQESYEIKTEEGGALEVSPCNNSRSKEDLIYLTVRLNNMETTVYDYKPQFENIETFSYVGGYVGMWLGISLIAVFDFMETLLMIAKYAYFRLKYLAGKRRKIRTGKIGHY